MPTEYKFDDLDLREQPARGDAIADIQTYGGNTCQTLRCGNTENCTFPCCPD